MAINLLTGLPGNGKTLYTLSHVEAWAKRDNRPVFYSGIPDLNLDWTEIDPEKWFECPANAIVVIDECQRIFRPRSAGKEPPPHVAHLETHRHGGIDLWLMTQHPNLADVALRRLTQKHMHIVRIWGMEAATIHEWQGAQTNCETESARSKSQKTKWRFDKKAYSYYKSAELHTVKRAIPARVIMLLVLPFIVVGLGYIAYQMLMKKTVAVAPAATTVRTPVSTSVPLSESAKSPVFDARSDAKNYVETHQPRIAGLLHTAPIYDEIRKPSQAPIPAACIESRSKGCTCYSQQGTVLVVPVNMCSEIVAKGFFDDSPKGSDLQNVNYSQGSAPASSPLAAVSYAPAFSSPNAVPSSQVAIASQAGNSRDASRDGYGLLGKSGQGVRHREYD